MIFGVSYWYFGPNSNTEQEKAMTFEENKEQAELSDEDQILLKAIEEDFESSTIALVPATKEDEISEQQEQEQQTAPLETPAPEIASLGLDQEGKEMDADEDEEIEEMTDYGDY